MAAGPRDPLHGPFAWTGAEPAQDGGWGRRWSPDDEAEIDNALRRAGWQCAAGQNFRPQPLARRGDSLRNNEQ
jgi:hypothetical protein